MTKMIFVNLPVSDLARSIAFYETVGFTNNAQFTDDTAASMTWADSVHVMLLTHAKWSTFTGKPIVDAHRQAQVMLCITIESRDAVDRITQGAAHAGGKPDVLPVQDHGVMYGRSFEDPDGHIWAPMWMDPMMSDASSSTEAAA